MHRFLALLLPLLFFQANAGMAAERPNFTKAHQDLVQILQGLIRVDTSNPPGNETRGADYIKALLSKADIPSEIFELEPGRGNLVARLPGNGKKKPLLLMGHLDVVGVEKDKWTVPAFEGVIKDGFLYGRGAMDDKGMLSACVEVMILLKKSGVKLDRDVILLAESGEEGTTHVGIDFMVEKHWDKISCEFALNEGGGIRENNGKIEFVGIATTEKFPRQTFLYAKGTSGHGSRPILDNPIIHIADAVAKVGKWQAPMRLNATTSEFFKRLAEISPPEEAALYRNLNDPMVQEKIRATKPNYNSMLRTSVAPTVLEGGFRINVIPGDARARLDIRLLPDENPEAFAETLRKLINNPRVEVVMSDSARKPAEPSSLDSEMFKVLEAVQKKMFPEAVTLPMMLTGATDSAQLRAKGVQAYGLGTVSTEEDGLKIHGNDERVSVAGLRQHLEFLYEAVIGIAAARE